jgi:hypothetical protein
MHLLCFCRDWSPDSSTWRINRRDSQYNRVLRVFPFPKLPAVGSLCRWVVVQIENFYDTFPHNLVEIALSDGNWLPMLCPTSGVFLDCFSDVLYTFAHPSIISTRSRTVLAYFAKDWPFLILRARVLSNRDDLPVMCVVLVRFDHIAGFIVNANHSIMWPAVKLRVADCIVDRVWLSVPQTAEGQHIAD